jgi:hypothetical protein
MRSLKIPEAEGFSAFEVEFSLVASTREASEVVKFYEFLNKTGRGHEQIICLSDKYAVTKNFHGPVLWTKDEIPCSPNFTGLEVEAHAPFVIDLQPHNLG